MLVVQGGLLKDLRQALGRPPAAVAGGQPRGQHFRDLQQLVRGAVQARLVGAGGDAVAPPVEPVPAPGGKAVAVLIAQQAAERGHRRHDDTRRAAGGIPVTHEVGQARVWRAVVDAQRMRGLPVEEIVRVIRIRLDPGDDLGQEAVHKPPVP